MAMSVFVHMTCEKLTITMPPKAIKRLKDLSRETGIPQSRIMLRAFEKFGRS